MFLALAAAGPYAHAVIPPPDGGYPGGNTAEGQNALFSLTTGGFNTAVGWLSLRSNTTSTGNTAVGAGALLANTGAANTATGAGALLSNTTGGANTADGAFALFHNNGDPPEGSANTAVGAGALFSNTTGDSNTAIGENALESNTTGSGNTAVGVRALDHNTAGNLNVAVGVNAGHNVVTAQNAICIGLNVFGADVGDSCYIGNIWNESGGSQAVYVNSEGKLGAQVSSGRFKDQIKPIDEASEVIYGLRPVSFRYKPEIEPTRPLSFGLIAEEVEKMSPELVTRDKEGKPYSVRYDQVNAMLLNEFLKEHRKVEDLEAMVARQQTQIEVLASGFQKLSAQIEVSRAGSQVVQVP